MKTCWMSTSFEQRQSERRFQQIAVALVVVLVSLQQNVAFGQSASAAVNGTGRDKSGALVSEAQLILKSTDTGVQHTDKTESAGVYSLTGIPPDYFARAVKNGFATMEETGMVLHVNQTATLDFTMGIGSLDQVVTVVANLLAVDSTTSELGTVIATTPVNDLPLSGRNFIELLSLAPGVSPISIAQNAAGGGSCGGLAIGAFTHRRGFLEMWPAARNWVSDHRYPHAGDIWAGAPG